MSTIASRVARRYLFSELGVGRTFFTGVLKIHRYRDQIQVTDLTNAGKRGKRVYEMNIVPTYTGGDADRQSVLDDLAAILVKCQNYECAEREVHNYIPTGLVKLDILITRLRGVDVEPMGTKIIYKTRTGLEIEASPNDFLVKSSVPLTHPKTGEPMNQTQDTLYWPENKQGAGIFYTWLKGNLSRLEHMDILDIRNFWDSLGVKWNSH